MDVKRFDMGDIDIAWCPGCGNYGILNILKQSLAELDIPQKNLVIVSGIGQAAKTPHYLKCNFFNGLHGRTLPPATAIKAVNPKLTVIAESGDGDMYGEGGNHLIHTIRRNPDITNIIHNNMVYGLTKGQASPTSERGFQTPMQVGGVILEPFNPLSVAIALDASFVARVYAADIKETKEILKKAIKHKGYSLVDVFQPCVSFNKINTYQWFKEHTYYLDETHDYTDRIKAFKKSIEKEKLPLGIFYIDTGKKTFESNQHVYRNNKEPLFYKKINFDKLNALVRSKK